VTAGMKRIKFKGFLNKIKKFLRNNEFSFLSIAVLQDCGAFKISLHIHPN
jgi:hypothetical protein